MPRFHLTMQSRNAKTGPIPVSTSSPDTCPDACPLAGAGCYADGGPLAIFWRAVAAGRAGGDWESFLSAVRQIAPGALWRHNQAGDLPGAGDALDTDALDQLTAANAGRRGFTFTHKPLRDPAERAAVARANAGGFAVNLSANDLRHADELSALNIAPVVVLLPRDAAENTATPAGRRVVVCPATQRDDISCARCGLCARVDRPVIVGFPAHGARARRADAIARAVA